MQKYQEDEFQFSFRIWSKNDSNEVAYSNEVCLSSMVLEKSNWLQGRVSPVVETQEQFSDWVIFISGTVDQFYRYSVIDRWYYYGPSNYELVSDEFKMFVDGREMEVQISNNHGLSKMQKSLKGKGDMRDEHLLFDFEQLHEYQVMPFAYYFLHFGSILSGDDFVDLNYPEGFDSENWEECERGWEVC